MPVTLELPDPTLPLSAVWRPLTLAMLNEPSGTEGADENVFVPPTVWFPVVFTTVVDAAIRASAAVLKSVMFDAVWVCDTSALLDRALERSPLVTYPARSSSVRKSSTSGISPASPFSPFRSARATRSCHEASPTYRHWTWVSPLRSSTSRPSSPFSPGVPPGVPPNQGPPGGTSFSQGSAMITPQPPRCYLQTGAGDGPQCSEPGAPQHGAWPGLPRRDRSSGRSPPETRRSHAATGHASGCPAPQPACQD